MRVVGLRAVCDLSATVRRDRREQDFDVSEFVVLENGDHVNLHAERGFSGRTNGADFWDQVTSDSIVRDVLSTVLPSAPDPVEGHPFGWLAELCRAKGIDANAADLRRVPYEVVLSDRVLTRLAAAGHTS